MRTCGLAFALASSVVLASCATAPATTPVPEPPRANAVSENAEALRVEAASILIRVNPSLEQAVREAAIQQPFLRAAGVNAQPARSPAFVIVMNYESRVDRKNQRSNMEGAIATGLTGLLLGSMVPWACATNHTLYAKVLRGDGEEVLAETVSAEENKVGTMLWCPDITEPSSGVATTMARTLFVKLEQTGVFKVSGRPPGD